MTKLERTGRRGRTRFTLLAVATMLASLLAPAALAHLEETDLTLQQDIVGQGYTAGELADMGYSNQPGTCGEQEGEVGWHFVTRGNNAHFDSADFVFGGTAYDLDERSASQYAGKDDLLKGIYFATAPDATLDQALATGVSNDNQFVLSHVCVPDTGDLQVQKFIDIDADGVLDLEDLTADDGTGNLAGWEFDVYSGTTVDAANYITTLTTDATGWTPTYELPVGTYTIREKNTGKTITTAVVGGSTTELTSDGDAILDNVSTKEVLVDATTTYTFGNACLITKVFEITAGTGTANVMAFYDTDLTDDAISDDAVHVSLSDGDNDGVYTGTAPDLFQIGDQIEWGFGVDTDGDGSLADEDAAFVDEAITDEDFVLADGYPSCIKTNTGELDNPEVTAFKLKDADDDGDPDDLHDPLDGWTLTLYDKATGAMLDQGDTGDDGPGAVTFEDLTIGKTYVVCEDLTSNANWLQTYPTDADAITYPDDCHEVGPLGIDESAEIAFHNSPLSEIRVGFTDLTGYTNVAIECVDAQGNTVYSYDSTTNGVEAAGSEDFNDAMDELIRISQSEVVCTFEVVDP